MRRPLIVFLYCKICYLSDGTTKIAKEDLVSGANEFRMKFKYGTDSTEYMTRVNSQANIRVSSYDKIYFYHMKYFNLNSNAFLLEQSDMTFLELKKYFWENWLHQEILWKSGLKPGLYLEKEVDYSISVLRFKKDGSFEIIDDLETIIWNDNNIITNPYKRDNIQVNINLTSIASSNILLLIKKKVKVSKKNNHQLQM